MTNSEDIRQSLQDSRYDQSPLTIVLTGCSRYVTCRQHGTFVSFTFLSFILYFYSGIGLHASKLLRDASPNSTLYLVARNEDNANRTVELVASTNPGTENRTIPMVCDHSSLGSVRLFCKDLRHRIQSETGKQKGIDVLCLNAAVLLGEDSGAMFTEDNLELTLQSNHVAPFLIANLLNDLLKPGGRVVVTTSGLHAFAKFNNFRGMRKNENKTKKRFEMIDGNSFDHKMSYSASKLCNVSFCLELNKRLEERGVVASCFTPGLIPSSGLFRHQKRWKETMLKKKTVCMDDTEEWGGNFLAWMAFSDQAGKEGGNYWRAPLGISKRGGKIPQDIFCAPVNEEAKDPRNRIELWNRSADLAGISADCIPDV